MNSRAPTTPGCFSSSRTPARRTGLAIGTHYSHRLEGSNRTPVARQCAPLSCSFERSPALNEEELVNELSDQWQGDNEEPADRVLRHQRVPGGAQRLAVTGWDGLEPA